ncbi:hypothetical protein JCM10908_006699 [Rhodotorula pacifica]|uniref:uncharacterized protein n=1 Tax=Rhodotorula pacifica TaxID=1495444 RepID=UPI003178A852
MSTRAAVKSRSGEPTPRKATRAPRPVQVHDDQLGWADLEAMREDFELEAASHARSLSKKLDERLAALARHFGDTLASLDTRVQAMPLSRYVSDFDSDPHRALRSLVEESMRPPAISAVEQSARKRKRVVPSSPAIGTHDDDLDVFGTVKKARGDAQYPASAKQETTRPLLGRGNSTRTTRTGNLVSPSSTRKPRIRIRPSQAASGKMPSREAAAVNFIYRQNEPVPPTPSRSKSAASTSAPGANSMPTPRQPRLGESIVMRSVNGSPLGEFVASDIEDEDDDNDSADSDEGDVEKDKTDAVASEEEWDMMDKNEASNVEHQSLTKAGRNRQQKGGNKLSQSGAGRKAKSAASKLVKSASTRSTVPSASAFEIALPDGAPSFDALKAKWLNDLKQKLLHSDIGEIERQRLEEVLSGMADL